MSTDAQNLDGAMDRLGLPGEIAESAAREYRQQRFAGRHPVLTFVLLPMVTLVVSWAAILASLVIVSTWLGFDSSAFTASPALSQSLGTAMPFILMGALVTPIALAAVFYSRLATKAGLSWKWILATCVILAIVGGTSLARLTLPTAVSEGSLIFVVGFGLIPNSQQLLQFAVPLAIGGWAVWRQMNHGRGAAALRV